MAQRKMHKILDVTSLGDGRDYKAISAERSPLTSELSVGERTAAGGGRKEASTAEGGG